MTTKIKDLQEKTKLTKGWEILVRNECDKMASGNWDAIVTGEIQSSWKPKTIHLEQPDKVWIL